MEIRFKNKQEENLFIVSAIILVIAGLNVVAAIFYSILK